MTHESLCCRTEEARWQHQTAGTSEGREAGRQGGHILEFNYYHLSYSFKVRRNGVFGSFRKKAPFKENNRSSGNPT
jgi:hypothetical protein